MTGTAGPALTIRSLRARAVMSPLKQPVRTAVGDIMDAPLVLVDVSTEQGITGSAYAFGYSPVTLGAIVRFINDIAPELSGKSVAPYARMRQLERRLKLAGWQGFAGMAIGALDMALWDALGKAAGLPVVSMLGGEPRALTAYDSYGTIDPKRDLGLLEASVTSGFRAIKIKLGAGDPAVDAETVASVRRTIGPDVRLMVDFNQSQSTASAVGLVARLRDFDLTWVEEPVAADDLRGHRMVRERVAPVPIQTGENWWFPTGMANSIAAGASDLAMIDIMKIGGVTGWLSAMGQAEAASLPVSSHVFVEASAHVMAITPTAHFLEYLDLAGGILSEPLTAVDGCVTARGPGLGITWDEKAVARFAVT
jgi:mandelate racemase